MNLKKFKEKYIDDEGNLLEDISIYETDIKGEEKSVKTSFENNILKVNDKDLNLEDIKIETDEGIFTLIKIETKRFGRKEIEVFLSNPKFEKQTLNIFKETDIENIYIEAREISKKENKIIIDEL